MADMAAQAIQEFDYIIVGAGSAGCVLAARPSEDSNLRVACWRREVRTTRPRSACPSPFPSCSRTKYDWDFAADRHTCITGDLRKMFYDGTRIAHHPRQFNIAGDLRASQRDAYYFWRSNSPHTCRCHRHSKPSSHQEQNSQPVRCLLHNLGSKPILLEQRQRLLKGAPSRSSRIVDKRFVAQYSGRNALLSRACMCHRKHRNIRLREERGHVQYLDGVPIAQYADIECPIFQTLGYPDVNDSYRCKCTLG